MTDRLATALAALDGVPPPPTLTWDLARTRAEDVDGAPLDPIDPAPEHGIGGPRRNRRRALLLAAAAVAVVGGLAVGLSRADDPPPAPVEAGPGPSTTASAPSSAPASSIVPTTAGQLTPTTQPAVGTSWGSAVQVWNGTEYLVCCGQVGDDGRGRADGWRYDPTTGETSAIPVAPIAPRDSAAGVWTGTELLVCCGRSMGSGPAYATDSAAAFDPATDTWRRLPDPPVTASGYVVGSAWTGDLFVVVLQKGDPNQMDSGDGVVVVAYDPATDTWTSRSEPAGGDRFGEVVWTGDRLVLWAASAAPGSDRGSSYDPAADTWTPLPALPDGASVTYGSIASVDGQLVVWGLDARDETRTVGHRLRIGDTAWRPMAEAPIPPIDHYDGTPGSQTLVADEDRDRVLVYPTHGYERGGGTGNPAPTLLAYDPVADTWDDLGPSAAQGYEPVLTVAGDLVLTPFRDRPLVLDLDR